MRNPIFCLVLAASSLLTGACDDDSAAPEAELADAGAGTAERPGTPRHDVDAGPAIRPLSIAPPVIDTHPACVLSADCPAGQYCDLGECIQDCNIDAPCDSGLECSARARCLGPSGKDEDPPPSTISEGTLSVTPLSANLTERDEFLSITLKSDAPGRVRYRIALDAPHLSFSAPRGSFVGETTLKLPVRSDRLVGAGSAGTVRVITTLGDATVSAPIRVGVTGAYEGAMTYDAGSVPLGTVGVALALREDDGAVTAQLDASRSLLFPVGEAGAAAGRGVFRRSDGVGFTITHDVPEGLGGKRNRFKRRMVRTIAFKLAPDDRGNLSGTFEERIHGLLTRQVTLTGTVSLRRRSLPEDTTFTATSQVEAPEVTTAHPLPLNDVFSPWTDSDCKSIRNPKTNAGEDCSLRADGTLPGECADALNYWASIANNVYYLLDGRYRGRTLEPIEDIAASCAVDLGRTPLALDIAGVQCAAVPRLARALSDVALSDAHGSSVSEAFARLFAHTLEPALLVAQDHVVSGMKQSFLEGGPARHVGALRSAGDTLAAPATWVMQPHLLEYLARIPALGTPAEKDGTLPHVEALRKLSRLFFVQSTLDGEQARAASLHPESRDEQLAQAQGSAVLTLLEAAAIAGVLERWGQSAPPDVGSELTDVLSPIDAGYRALLQGDLVFGVLEGFVPFMNRRGDESTNFEQVLSGVQPLFTQLAKDEGAFTEANRTYERNDAAFEEQLVQIRTGVEAAIADVCGSSFVIDAATSDKSWAACGKDWAGEVGALLLGIEQARSRLQASQERIHGMAEKIEIEERRIRDVKEVRDGTIAFVGKNGEKNVELDIREGVINASEKFFEIASHASIGNLGAPIANAAIVSVLETMRTDVTVQRDRLNTAKEMRIRGDDASVEVMNGMAVVQSMTVDLAQLAVEMQQDLIGLLQAQISAGTAVDRARRLHSDRAKLLALASKSPLRDPSFRILQDRAAFQAIRSRASAQQGLYLALRALEYELNQPFGAAGSKAVFSAFNSAETERLESCLKKIAVEAALAKGQPQTYVTELSVRKVLGVTAERKDSVTGEVLGLGDQFRRILLQNENLDGHGGVGVSFASSAQPGNGLWPLNVCDDKIRSVAVQVVGDFSGDDDAQVELALEGGGVLRRCDQNALVNWSTSALAVVQAGVNSFGSAAPNRSLAGRSVASSRFKLTIPGKEIAPANLDLNLGKIEDVVIRIEHEARPASQSQTPISLQCLTDSSAP
jgi:hypothetical protein